MIKAASPDIHYFSMGAADSGDGSRTGNVGRRGWATSPGKIKIGELFGRIGRRLAGDNQSEPSAAFFALDPKPFGAVWFLVPSHFLLHHTIFFSAPQHRCLRYSFCMPF